MRNSIRFLGAVVCMGAMLAGSSSTLADPLGLDSTSNEPVLPEIQPYAGPAFSAASATAGTADPGPALEVVPGDNRTCSAFNPCATPSPALTNSDGNMTASRAAQATKYPGKPAKHPALASERR